VTRLLEHLRSRSKGGRKLLVPYLVAGTPEPTAYPAALAAVARHADAVEVGLPYSDPLMDGPVIAAAADRAIASGVGPLDALERGDKIDVPKLAMTYYNPIHSTGEDDFCARAATAGFAGLIVPDLPLEESQSLRAAAAEHDLAWVPLVAPTTSDRRVADIAGTATGFVYAVSTLGVTGVRTALQERAARVAERCKAVTDVPVLVGIGVSTPDQAVEATRVADGVVIGSAVVARVMDEGAEAAADFLAGVRTALDA
jgi:tryptophan synthase alpha chain